MEHALTLPSTIDEVSYDWCLGKPAGYILKKEAKVGSSKHGSVSYRCNAGGKQHGKMFGISETRDEHAATRAAMEYGIRWSDEHGFTKNKVRRLPDGIHWKDNIYNVSVTKNTLEVFIDDEHTMLIDFEDLPHVQQHALTKTSSANENSQAYAIFSFKGTRAEKKQGKTMMKRVHNYLTGYDMVDHINRNPLDNRRVNLRDTTPKQNNNNRTCKNAVPGVRFVNDRPQGSWQARIKQDDIEYTKSFSVKVHGGDAAYEMAVNARTNFCKSFACSNSSLHNQIL